ncbi:MAG: hypothetical protein A4E65_02281 [Syntrophorhabdus sp. PtaU1.Bin153]|nr:MAG: hypothetical protein A4E65_02281 [Syntrophorhabdus sp. PtaU1.Bin153]
MTETLRQGDNLIHKGSTHKGGKFPCPGPCGCDKLDLGLAGEFLRNISCNLKGSSFVTYVSTLQDIVLSIHDDNAYTNGTNINPNSMHLATSMLDNAFDLKRIVMLIIIHRTFNQEDLDDDQGPYTGERSGSGRFLPA